jgi:hypothetical protein
MTWQEAISACNGLGSGWRLPNKEDLKAMYEQLHGKAQGNFKEADFCSST